MGLLFLPTTRESTLSVLFTGSSLARSFVSEDLSLVLLIGTSLLISSSTATLKSSRRRRRNRLPRLRNRLLPPPFMMRSSLMLLMLVMELLLPRLLLEVRPLHQRCLSLVGRNGLLPVMTQRLPVPASGRVQSEKDP